MEKTSKPPRFKIENRDIQRYIVFAYLKRAVGNALFVVASVFFAFQLCTSEFGNQVIGISAGVILSLASFFIFGWHKVIKEEHAKKQTEGDDRLLEVLSRKRERKG